MRSKFIRDGRLTWGAEVLLAIVFIFGIFGIPVFDLSLWLSIPIGLAAIVSGLILMFEGRATALGLKPFTNDPLGWRAAKKSYVKADHSNEEGDKSS